MNTLRRRAGFFNPGANPLRITKASQLTRRIKQYENKRSAFHVCHHHQAVARLGNEPGFLQTDRPARRSNEPVRVVETERLAGGLHSQRTGG